MYNLLLSKLFHRDLLFNSFNGILITIIHIGLQISTIVKIIKYITKAFEIKCTLFVSLENGTFLNTNIYMKYYVTYCFQNVYEILCNLLLSKCSIYLNYDNVYISNCELQPLLKLLNILLKHLKSNVPNLIH
ncbi:hypothetical protein LY90DRAFT_516666 [Neocallimastix californiae]|uniref:Uncharacterized protein n=1 Tax=Neocallimastix californiae TaxID=1754190 RepID=A0A1Y2ADJ4_9FUNG|nr:hypothetical protein LY90DRAFT_516666 [Neocallimastix californiae]|eukprot:ORY20591.1 hypothetical protein LY90DRAFT_516666 [Neocallimastix californiae]